ncbi:hypothetical protein HPB51_015994 [Rhipicephalus microplus]|uniref:DRBM domain-containing protein n=1 Tax=Rhipicephalus microplus TaxID=6941 RepID=A0A9J6DI60_RHIMP|nr:hypothetical protein HPB51_015994 [Rhipicephalus microplus]
MHRSMETERLDDTLGVNPCVFVTVENSFGLQKRWSKRAALHTCAPFRTRCTVGEISGEGEGNGKKASKKEAAQGVLEQLRKLPPIEPPPGSAVTSTGPGGVQLQKRRAPPKKRARNLVRDQQAATPPCEDYESTDENVRTCLEETVEEMIAEVQDEDQPFSDECDDNTASAVVPPDRSAKEAVELLQRYFEHEACPEFLASLSGMGAFLVKKQLKLAEQTTLHSFFFSYSSS